MNWRALLAYRPSESTIVGIATIVGCVVGLRLHQLPYDAALPLLAGAATSILLPGNAAGTVAARKLALDVIAAKQPGASPLTVAQTIGGDAFDLERAVGQPQP